MRRGRAGQGPLDERNRKLLGVYEQLQAVRKRCNDEPAFGSIVALMTCQMAAGSGASFDALVAQLRPLYDDGARGVAQMRKTVAQMPDLQATTDAEVARRKREGSDDQT